MTDTEQYYPTPPALVADMQSTFKNSFLRGNCEILEPSCGTGDLLKYVPRHGPDDVSFHKADALEINPDRLSQLSRIKELSVVGHDFLSFEPEKMYSHIIMNPPFRSGAKHLLHAWDISYNTEIVCLLNAETFRNSESRDYKLIRDLIDEHGSYEFRENEFTCPESQRKTTVETVIIYLLKQTPASESFLDGLYQDIEEPKFNHVDFNNGELAIPANVIQNAVMNYNKAKEVLHRKIESSAVLRAEYSRYSSIFGGSLVETSAEASKRQESSTRARFLAQPDQMLEAYNEEISSLKQSAWNYVLTGIGFYKQLSNQASKKFRSEFAQVSKLAFTEANIHGFLYGVSLQRGAMDDEMMLSLFDKITERYQDNRQYYRSWKSNEKHRSAAWRIKMSRIVLPITVRSDWGDRFAYDAEAQLLDLDKCLAALDGAKRVEDTFGLCQAMKEKRHNGRHDSDYFEYRCYSSTIHLYPKRKDLIDRLNRTVGRLRAWLPEEEDQATPEFWENYDSQQTTKDVDANAPSGYSWNGSKTIEDISDAIDESMNGQGIDPDRFAVRIGKSESKDLVLG